MPKEDTDSIDVEIYLAVDSTGYYEVGKVLADIDADAMTAITKVLKLQLKIQRPQPSVLDISLIPDNEKSLPAPIQLLKIETKDK